MFQVLAGKMHLTLCMQDQQVSEEKAKYVILHGGLKSLFEIEKREKRYLGHIF